MTRINNNRDGCGRAQSKGKVAGAACNAGIRFKIWAMSRVDCVDLLQGTVVYKEEIIQNQDQ